MVRIRGQKDFTLTAEIEFLPGITVRINALPFGFDEQMENLLPSPKAPEKPVKDVRTGKYKVKPGSVQLEMEVDEKDPDYLAATKSQTRRQCAFIIYYGTKEDKEWVWDSKKQESDGIPFFDDIYEELKKAKIGAGYIIKLVSEIMKLSGVGEEQIEAVKMTFLATEVSEAPLDPSST
jgi:hypothetical protein